MFLFGKRESELIIFFKVKSFDFKVLIVFRNQDIKKFNLCVSQLILFALNSNLIKNWKIFLIEFERFLLFSFLSINFLFIHVIFLWCIFWLVAFLITVLLLVNYFLLVNPYLLRFTICIIVVVFCVNYIIQITFCLLTFLFQTHFLLFLLLVKNEIFSPLDLLKDKSWNLALSYHTTIDFDFIISFIRNLSDQSFTLTNIYFRFFSFNSSEMSDWFAVFIKCRN